MSAARIPLVGGPLDGHEIPKVAGRIAWVSGQLRQTTGIFHLRGGAARSSPTNGRALYRLGRAASGGLAYLYEGHRTVYCNRCEAYHDKREGGSERPACARRQQRA